MKTQKFPCLSPTAAGGCPIGLHMFSFCEEVSVSSCNHTVVLKLLSKVLHVCLHLSEVQMETLSDCHWPCKEILFALSECRVLRTKLVDCVVLMLWCLIPLHGINWLLLEFNLNDTSLQQG